jgi:hypothetical protein
MDEDERETNLKTKEVMSIENIFKLLNREKLTLNDSALDYR